MFEAPSVDEKLRGAATGNLAAWLKRTPAVTRAVMRACQVAEVLHLVLKAWEGADDPAKPFLVGLSHRKASGAFTETRLQEAARMIETMGFQVRWLPAKYGTGRDWSVTAKPERVAQKALDDERAVEREAAALDTASPLPMPIGAPHPDALTQKHAMTCGVAGEVWVIPLEEHREKRQGGDKVTYTAGNFAYRLPRSTRVPEHYKRRKAPDWVTALLSAKAWAPWRDFQVGPKAQSAMGMISGFTPTDDARYGLTGIVWVDDEFATTDGNSLHVVMVPERAPDALRGIMYDRRCWGQPCMLSSGRYVSSDGGFNLTPSLAVKVGPFPDYKQVMPSRFTDVFYLRIEDMKRIEAAIKEIPRLKVGTIAMLRIEVGPRGFSPWGLSWTTPDEQRHKVDLQGPEVEEGNPGQVRYVDAKRFAKVLAAFRRQGSIAFLRCDRGYLSPMQLDQTAGNPSKLLQLAILMPVRAD